MSPSLLSQPALNPEQQAVVDAPKEAGIQVLAGAGTGKTTLIASRFVALVERLRAEGFEQPESRILAISYTEAAAADLKRKIVNALAQQASNEMNPDIEDSLCISTFHAFCKTVLQAHGNRLGLGVAFDLLDGFDQRERLQTLLEEIRQGRWQDLSDVLVRSGLMGIIPPDCLNPQQLIASGPLGVPLPVELLLSVLQNLPGILQRVKTLGLSPKAFYEQTHRQNVHLITFLKNIPLKDPLTQAWIEEMRDCCVLWKDYFQPYSASTWDPLSIEQDSGWEGLPKSSEYKKQLAFLMKPLNLFEGRAKKGIYPFTPPDFSLLEEESRHEEACLILITAIYALYLDQLLQNNQSDFDTLIDWTITLFEQYPDLRKRYQTQFEHLIVDEFQDSNPAQLRLLRLLMREEMPCLTVVGDEKQGIYGFRFAQRENLDLIFEGYSYQRVVLRTNYRCHPSILTVSNQLTQLLPGAEAKQTLAPFAEVPVDEMSVLPHVTWATFGPSGAACNDAEEPEKTPVAVLRQRESQWIASEIADLIASGRYQAKDIAVLVKNHRKAQGLQQALARVGVPSVRERMPDFFQQSVIKTAVALLTVLSSTQPVDVETQACIRLLQHLLSDRSLRQIVKAAKSDEQSLFVWLKQCLTSQEKLHACLDNLQELTGVVQLWGNFYQLRQARSGKLAVQLFQEALMEVYALLFVQNEAESVDPLLSQFLKVLLALSGEARNPTPLSVVLRRLAEYQSDATLTLPFEEEVEGLLEAPEQDAVHLMTVHSSKGLEFPVVFVAYVDAESSQKESRSLLFEPQFPGKAGFGLFLDKLGARKTVKSAVYETIWRKPRRHDEAKRLFYVALTRAKQRLYVSRSKQSPVFTDPEVLSLERFPDAVRCLQFEQVPVTSCAARPLLAQALPEDTSEWGGLDEGVVQRFLAYSAEQRQVLRAISYSGLQDYRTCPVLFWLKHLMQLAPIAFAPPQQEETEQALARGRCLHRLLQLHYEHRGVLSAEMVDDTLIFYGLFEQEAERNWVEARLAAFLNSSYTYTRLNQGGCQVSSEFTQSGLVRSAVLQDVPVSVFATAKIDLVIWQPTQVLTEKNAAEKALSGHVTLIDFKSSLSTQPHVLASWQEQLTWYKFLFQQAGRYSAEQIALTVLRLTESEVIPLTVELPAQAEAVERLTALLENGIFPLFSAIAAGQSPETLCPERPSNAPCETCSFEALCPQRASIA